MKIVSWNVNGIRSLYNQGYWNWFLEEQPDILCVQETKANPEQLPEELRNPNSYFSYFSSSILKNGYSGVAIYTKTEPEKVEYGMGIARFDDEGRILMAHFKDFTLLTVYFPNGGQGPHRLKYKMEFYDAFLEFIEKIRKSGKKIVFCGDINTAHTEIDLARPKENILNTGFLPEERAWIDEVINKGYIDTFRYFYPEKTGAYTYWDVKTRSRERNVGWRLDYFFVSNELQKEITKAKILENVYGSDHCPIVLELK